MVGGTIFTGGGNIDASGGTLSMVGGTISTGGGGITDASGNFGTQFQTLYSTGTSVKWRDTPLIWGSFSSTQSQAVTGANTTTFATYDTSDVALTGVDFSGATPTSGIKVSVAASKLRIQSSLIVSSGANNTTFRFWLRKNGANLANTASTIIIKDSGDQTLEVCEWYVSCAANDIFEVAFQADDASASLVRVVAGGTPPDDYPATPSIITTVLGYF